MKKLISISLLAILIVGFTSCSKSPDTEVTKVKELIESTKTLEADRYLPVEFNGLNDSLNVALVEIEKQDGKFFILRNYSSAKTTLTSAINLGEILKTNTVIKKEEVKKQAQETLIKTNTLISDVKILMEKAPLGKEGRVVLESMKTDISVIEATLMEVNTLINNGDYLTALDKVNASHEKILSIKAELDAAIDKVL